MGLTVRAQQCELFRQGQALVPAIQISVAAILSYRLRGAVSLVFGAEINAVLRDRPVAPKSAARQAASSSSEALR